MATTALVQYPNHEQHLLESWDFSNHSITYLCDHCHMKISPADGYTCKECDFRDVYRAYSEAPPSIYLHPIQPEQPLTLLHYPFPERDNDFNSCFGSDSSLSMCYESNFNLDISRYALSPLSDTADHLGGKPSEQLQSHPPKTIQYPHHPNHNHMLIDCPVNNNLQCDSCSCFVNGSMCYGCPSCEFFVDVRCALKVLDYIGKGMNAEIDRPWHEHPLLLCHRLEYDWDCCSNCEEKSAGPMYACKEESCKLLLHMRCIEIESTILHPHHPDHRLAHCSQKSDKICNACGEIIDHLHFSCELCAFYLHAKCAALDATRKHAIHEHDLLHMDKATFWKCNRCETDISSCFFRCVPCDFNLHEKCVELPLQVMNRKFHRHPLTLHELYVEDDHGEYYCYKCEKRRDERMGVYVCRQCQQNSTYHIECVLPELRKLCEKNPTADEIKRLMSMDEDIKKREEEVRQVGIKLEEMKRKLDVQKKERKILMHNLETILNTC